MSERFANELRKAIAASDISRYRMAKEIGVSEALLSRFMTGKAGLGLATINKLADRLGLHVTVSKPKRRTRR